MTLPKAQLKHTSLRGLDRRELETEYNRIWEELENEVKQVLKAMIDSGLRMRQYSVAGSAVPMPTTYTKFILIYDSEDNFIGQIPIFS